MAGYQFVEGDEKLVGGQRVRRIMRSDGKLGGYINDEANLAQTGRCFVHEQSVVLDNARVADDAQVYGKMSNKSRAEGASNVYGEMMDYAVILDNATLYGSMSGSARLEENAILYGNASGNAVVRGNSVVYGNVDNDNID